MIGIYKITSPTGKIYIGQSVNIERRMKRYKALDCVKQYKVHRSFLKHGFENHKLEVVCECDVEDLNNKERYYQDLFDSMNSGLNCLLTESTDKRRVVSKETIEKIRQIHLGRVDSDEVRKKRSNSQTGLKRTDEQKEKMSIARKGIFHSLETKKRMSEAGKGKKRTIESRIKMSESRKGMQHTEEAKAKMSLYASNRPQEVNDKISNSLKGKVTPDSVRLKMSLSQIERHSKNPKVIYIHKRKSVVCTETNEVYKTVADCARANGFKKSTLAAKLNGVNSNNTSFIFLNNKL